MSERWCQSGQHFTLRSRFRMVGTQIDGNAKLARDCIACEEMKKPPEHLRFKGASLDKPFPGVDIDAIHYKLGAVKKIPKRGKWQWMFVRAPRRLTKQPAKIGRPRKMGIYLRPWK